MRDAALVAGQDARPGLVSCSLSLLHDVADRELLSGVYQSRDAYASTTAALHAGYSHIDTARVYKRDLAATGLGSSESVVAQAVHDFAERQQRRGGGAPRRTFLTTKVNAREHGLDKARLAIDDSIRRADEHGQNWVRRGHAAVVSQTRVSRAEQPL